jgi:hypothetical protein
VIHELLRGLASATAGTAHHNAGPLSLRHFPHKVEVQFGERVKDSALDVRVLEFGGCAYVQEQRV